MDRRDDIKAALIVIGNEILSGRTQDINIQWIAEKLGSKGIALAEVRIVPDIKDAIIKAVNELRAEVDYLFTTGGIGPTHDDITAESIASAFGVPVEQNEEAFRILKDHYGESELTPSRLKMAAVPNGAGLIRNPVSAAPGFIIGNVYVMAGVPKIMQGMLENVLPLMQSGATVFSNTLICEIPESRIAESLEALQKKYMDINIGSYPRFHPGRSALSLVLRGRNAEILRAATGELIKIIEEIDPYYTTELQAPLD